MQARIWHQKALKVPKKRRLGGQSWLNGGDSCVRQRPMRENHACSSDSESASTHDGRPLRLFTPLDAPGRHIAIVLNPTCCEDLLDVPATSTILGIFFVQKTHQ